jgi:hypothetical protein
MGREAARRFRQRPLHVRARRRGGHRSRDATDEIECAAACAAGRRVRGACDRRCGIPRDDNQRYRGAHRRSRAAYATGFCAWRTMAHPARTSDGSRCRRDHPVRRAGTGARRAAIADDGTRRDAAGPVAAVADFDSRDRSRGAGTARDERRGLAARCAARAGGARAVECRTGCRNPFRSDPEAGRFRAALNRSGRSRG